MGSIKGHILINSFLKTEKFMEHYRYLESSARKYGSSLSVIENADILCSYGTGGEERISSMLGGSSFLLYWDKDIRLGRQLEKICHRKGIIVCNPVDSIAACDDKSLTYQKLWEWNNNTEEFKIPLIPTITAPMAYANTGYTNTRFLDKVIEELSLPLIVKECYGSFGMQVYLAKTRKQLEDIVLKLGGTPHIYQKFIKESSGRDVRIEVAGGEVVAAMYRHSANGDFRANITIGAEMEPYSPSEEECRIALCAAEALGLDFGGVDLLFTDSGSRAGLLCEVNSNAHFKNIYDCTGINVADKIISYILASVKARH
ncbi:MAG: RimK family alpha-L-glutamate ligase [Lachnospiraceae bacterium]|nr:RimK family alpha-L-glutamate ligase [Lachnospiraceae bacterium]